MKNNPYPYFFFDTKEKIQEVEKRWDDHAHQSPNGKDYTLTLDDAVAIREEEHRIVRDWLKAGIISEDLEMEEYYLKLRCFLLVIKIGLTKNI